MVSSAIFVLDRFTGHIRAFVWIFCFRRLCLAQLNDGHYDEEDDAKVLPIVLPIVLVVAITCIIACCWQGKKCPCNKNDDDPKKKNRDNDESNVGDSVRMENEKKTSVRNKTSANSVRKSGHQHQPPPDYSSLAGQRNKDLPGRPTTRQGSTTANGERQYKKKASNYPRSNGFDTEVNLHVRPSEKHRVYDDRSQRTHGSRRDQQAHERYPESNRNGYGGRSSVNDTSSKRDHRAYR